MANRDCSKYLTRNSNRLHNILCIVKSEYFSNDSKIKEINKILNEYLKDSFMNENTYTKEQVESETFKKKFLFNDS